MKVLLIEPPFIRLRRINTAFFPIGLGYLAGVLAKNCIDVKIYNAELTNETFKADGDSYGTYKYKPLLAQHGYYKEALADHDHGVWREIEATIDEQKPDAVGITSRSAKFPSALRVAAIVKKLNPKTYVIIGGPHPTIEPDECVQDQNIDFVVRGEGEETLLELCQVLDTDGDYGQIPGLSFKKGDVAIHNEQRGLIRDLDSLPFPARDLVINPSSFPTDAMASLVTSRGCSFKCGYCSAASMWTRKVRTRGVENSIAEIKYIVDTYNTKTIYFWDDSFTINRRRIFALCDAINDANLGIRWSCTTRVDLVDDELLAAMRGAGCVHIDIGVESGSERILKLIDKGISVEKVKSAVALIHKHNIQISAFFMVGFPEETEGDILQTIELMKTIDVSSICLSIFTPYPGTALYEKAHSLGLIPEVIDWADFDHHSPENFFMANIEKDVFERLVVEMMEIADQYRSFSFSKSIQIMKTNSKYYLKNPRLFFAKATQKILAKLRLASS